jgi:Fic family protein
MESLLFFGIGIVFGFYLKGKFFSGGGNVIGSKVLKTDEELDEMRVGSQEALKERTEERKKEILEMMKREEEHQKALMGCDLEVEVKGIASSDVEELLGVEGKTARKYLNELEKENKIKQVGERGQGVYYILQ